MSSHIFPLWIIFATSRAIVSLRLTVALLWHHMQWPLFNSSFRFSWIRWHHNRFNVNGSLGFYDLDVFLLLFHFMIVQRLSWNGSSILATKENGQMKSAEIDMCHVTTNIISGWKDFNHLDTTRPLSHFTVIVTKNDATIVLNDHTLDARLPRCIRLNCRTWYHFAAGIRHNATFLLQYQSVRLICVWNKKEIHRH